MRHLGIRTPPALTPDGRHSGRATCSGGSRRLTAGTGAWSHEPSGRGTTCSSTTGSIAKGCARYTSAPHASSRSGTATGERHSRCTARRRSRSGSAWNPRPLRRLLARHDCGEWTFVTAWNPASVPLTDAENARRNAALRAELERRWTALAGVGAGEDASWTPEESFLGARHPPRGGGGHRTQVWPARHRPRHVTHGSGTRALRAADYAAVMSVLARSSPTNSKASRAAAAEA